jgi:transposase
VLEYKYKASSTGNAPSSTMHTLSAASQNHILSMLDAGYSAGHISASTGHGIATVSRLRSKHRPHLSKSSGGRPAKLSSANIRHAQRLISSGKVDTAVDAAKALSNVTNQSLSAQTVRRSLKVAGLKAVAKKKKPFLSKRHKKERMDFALAHQHWTVEDWKKVVWSDETKINRLGSDGRKWVWKKAGCHENDIPKDPPQIFLNSVQNQLSQSFHIHFNSQTHTHINAG